MNSAARKRSGGGGGLVCAFRAARLARTPAGTRCGTLFLFTFAGRDRRSAVRADGRGKHVEGQAAVVAVHRRGLGLVGRAILALEACGAAPAALGALAPRLAFLGLALAFGRFQLLAVIVVDVVAAPRPLVLEPRAILTENAEIMVRVLEIIFGLHPVAGELRVARQALVFLEQLGGIAALTVVLAVARLSTEALPPLPTAAATAAALSLIDQTLKSLLQVL